MKIVIGLLLFTVCSSAHAIQWIKAKVAYEALAFQRLNKLIGIKFNIIFTDLVEGVFQMFLNVIQAGENHRE